MKKALIFAGLAGLGYTAFRVWRLTGLHVTNDPASSTIPFSDALKSQASGWIPVASGLALLAAYTVAQ
jgi:hypothetical protein